MLINEEIDDSGSAGGTSANATTISDTIRNVIVPSTRVSALPKLDQESLENLLRKPVYLFDISVTNALTATQIVSTDLIANWLSTTKIQDLVSTKYTYFRGRPKLTFTFNGSPYFYGLGLAAVHADPGKSSLNGGNFKPAIVPLRKPQIYQLPHVTIDYSKSETLTLTLPWICTTDSALTSALADIGDTYYSLLFSPFNTIAAIDSTAIPNPTVLINVYMEMEECELSYMSAQGPKEMEENGVLSMPIKSVSNLIKKHSPFPMYTTPYTDVADGVAKLLSKVGFGRQPVMDFNLIQRANNFQHTTEDGRTYAPTVANQLKQCKTIGNEELGFGGGNDMVIAEICNRWGLIGQNPWSTTTAKGAYLARPLIRPWQAYVDTDNAIIPTPLSFVAACFAFARCDMELRIEIIGTAFHKGVMLVTPMPINFAAQPLTTLINNSRSVLVDIGNTREVIIPIPYTRNTPYLASGLNAGGLINGMAVTDDVDKYQCCVHIVVMSPLSVGITANNQSVYLNYYVRAVGTPDFQQPTMAWFNTTGGSRAGHTQPGRVVIQGPLVEQGPESDVCYCGPGGDSTQITSYSKVKEMHPYVFGESFSSIKQLMNILSPYILTYTTSSGTAGLFQISRLDLMGKPLAPKLNNATSGWSATMPTTPNNQQTFNFQNYLPLAFTAQKGGFILGIWSPFYSDNADTRKMVKIDPDDQVYKVRFARMQNALAITNGITATAYATDAVVDTTGRQVMSFGDSNLFQFKVPDMSNLKYYPASNGNVSYATSDVNSALFYPGVQVFVPQVTPASISLGNRFINIYVAGADDNTLHHFQCAPCIF